MGRLIEQAAEHYFANREAHGFIVNLIAGTTTRKGLKVHPEIVDHLHLAGTKVPDGEMDRLNLWRDDFHGEWNYQILPRS